MKVNILEQPNMFIRKDCPDFCVYLDEILYNIVIDEVVVWMSWGIPCLELIHMWKVHAILVLLCDSLLIGGKK